MTELRLAIAGFGNVGRALAAESPHLRSRIGVDTSIIAVSDPRYGTVIDPAGIDGLALAKAAEDDGSFAAIAGYRADLDTLGMIETASADVLAELTFTDLATGEPALSHVEAAIGRGMHVSTTNKGPIALRLDDLEHAAARRGVVLAFEGTVMSGTPAVAVARDSIRPAGFTAALGILNGTTNYMLGRIEDGLTFDASLSEAQELGYAEADPSGDIDGHDAAAKLVILARVLTGHALPVASVAAEPLSSIDADAVRSALADGSRWKYVAELDATGAEITARVGPQRLAADHPLSAVDGSTNAVTFETELLGPVTLIGAGAGRTETVTSVLADLVAISKQR